MLQREGVETHETLSHRFVRHECPVGRSLSRASSRLGDASLCGFCLAWLSPHYWAPALNEPKQSPTGVVSGYALRFSVL
jgi:hypothetical protein